LDSDRSSGCNAFLAALAMLWLLLPLLLLLLVLFDAAQVCHQLHVGRALLVQNLASCSKGIEVV